jgi:hypothetical protein
MTNTLQGMFSVSEIHDVSGAATQRPFEIEGHLVPEQWALVSGMHQVWLLVPAGAGRMTRRHDCN